MAYSTQRTTSDGTLVALDLAIEYLDRSEIAVILDGVVSTAWSWVGTTEKRIEFPSALVLGTDVLIVRTTDLSGVRHVFEGGAAFTYSSVDENYEQILHIAQEARENATLSDVYGDIDMHGFQIKNTAPATEPTDLVTFSQFSTHDAQIIIYRDQCAGYAAAAAASAASITPVAEQTHSATSKGTPVDTDELPLVDSENSFSLKKLTWTNLKLALNSLYMAVVAPGTAGYVLTSTGTGWISALVPTRAALGTAVATTGGTAHDVTGIPPWVTRITVSLHSVVRSSNDPLLWQVGAGTITSSGYSSVASRASGNAITSGSASAGFNLVSVSSANTISGIFTLHRHSTDSHTWTAVHEAKDTSENHYSGCGDITLSGQLDRVRFTTSTGAGTFTGGSIGVLYEG